MDNPNARFDENWLPPLLNVRVLLAYVALFFWLSFHEAKADVTVIYDTGTASPLSDFVKAPKLMVPAQLPDIDLQASADFTTQLFPIHTPELTPGAVNPQATHLLLPQAFFIVGCDERSRQWLSQFKERLSQIGAVGLQSDARFLTHLPNRAAAGLAVAGVI